MTVKQKKLILRIVLAFVVFAVALLIPVNKTVKLFIYLASYAVAGYSVVIKAVKNILKGRFLTRIFL